MNISTGWEKATEAWELLHGQHGFYRLIILRSSVSALLFLLIAQWATIFLATNFAEAFYTLLQASHWCYEGPSILGLMSICQGLLTNTTSINMLPAQSSLFILIVGMICSKFYFEMAIMAKTLHALHKPSMRGLFYNKKVTTLAIMVSTVLSCMVFIMGIWGPAIFRKEIIIHPVLHGILVFGCIPIMLFGLFWLIAKIFLLQVLAYDQQSLRSSISHAYTSFGRAWWAFVGISLRQLYMFIIFTLVVGGPLGCIWMITGTNTLFSILGAIAVWLFVVFCILLGNMWSIAKSLLYIEYREPSFTRASPTSPQSLPQD